MWEELLFEDHKTSSAPKLLQLTTNQFSRSDFQMNTVVEFLVHVVYSFTRSVAEHSNFDEDDHNLELFGYNPLDDTGREWYCQPVDELIYQENSERDATVIDYLPSSSIGARLINACSTDSMDATESIGSDGSMAWKQLRPSFLYTVWKSVYFGFLMSVLSALMIGIVSILVYYVSFQTQLACLTHPEELIPNKLRWIRTISEAIFVFFLYCWVFLDILFYFRPFQISGIRLRIFLTVLVFYILDVFYRIAIQAFGFSHFKLTKIQVLPGNVLFFLCLCIAFRIITRHFCAGPRKRQFSLFLSLIVPCVLMLVTGTLLGYFLYPAYNRQNETGKTLIAIFTPLITVVLKGVSRFCVQRLWRLSHPGASYILLVPLYCGSAIMLRLLQVDLESVEAVALIGVIHGIAEVIERSTMVLIDHICHQLWERKIVRCGEFRTPRRERLAADIAIMSMLFESSAIISVNGFLHLYRYFYTSDNSVVQLLQSFATTTSVPLAIEWFFSSMSLAIETRYQNMPVMAVWRRRWKNHIAVAMLNAVMIAGWLSSRLILKVVEDRFVSSNDFCQMPFHL